MKKSYQRKRLRRLAAILSAVLAMGTAGFSPVLYANPILDSKDAAVSISGTTNMDISSTAANNVIKWVDFSIGAGEKVAFDANNYLNYVTGSARSEIYGMLTGGGSIYLINPNGILIGDSAAINVGNLYLSTRNLSDDVLNEFSASGVNPLRAGNVTGDVINLGKLNANSVVVEGNNITFKNVADVTKGGEISGETITGGTVHNDSNVKLTANSAGEIHIGSDAGGELPAYTMSGTNKQYMYKLVSTAAELQAINNDLDGNYMLKNNITSDLESFTPIGKSYDNAFAGRFDGLNYKIENLHIKVDDRFNTRAGLFGVNKGTIENLEVAGATVTNGTDLRLNQIGAVAGVNYQNATIRNVRNTGAIDYSAADNGVDYFGGIVGVNNGTIERAYNTGNLTGNSDKNTSYTKIGGIAGQNDGVIKYAFNKGNITDSGTGTNWSRLGGIAANMGEYDYGRTIENAYNSGQITTSKTGNTYLGGIAGYLHSGTINHTYNSGTLSLPEGFSADAGGIVGYKLSGAVQDSYSTATKKSGSYHADGILLTDENKKKKETYSDFDFSEGGAWRIYEEQTMPLLTAFLKRKDNSKGETVYNGTATGDVGANYSDPTYSGTVNQIGGFNYIKDYTIVTPKELTVTNVNKTYDGTDTATIEGANLSDVVTGDTLTVSTTSATYADKNAGTKAVNYTGLTLSGAKAKNYSIAKDGVTTGTITAKAITASFDYITKTYDGTTNATAGAGTLSDVVTGDTVSVTANAAAYDDKNIGSRTVTYTGVALTGTDANNYTIADTATGLGVISAKTITATFDAISKIYDGTTDATAGAGTLSDLVTGDTVSVTANAAYDSKNAGSRTVNYTNVALSGADAGNYSIAATATGSGTINKADVTISVSDYTRAYDGTADASGAELTTTAGEIFAGDSMSGGTKTFTGGEDVQNVGTGKTITVADVTINDGNGGNNYNVTYQNGIGSITRKALSLVADPVSITEGAATPTAFSGELTGFVAGEDLAAGDSYAFHLSGTPTAVGKYAITGTLKVGDNDPATSGDYGQNYTFANAEGNATAFAINAKPAPAPSSGSSSGSSGGSGNSGSVTPTIPTVPTDIAPANSATSDHSASGTPSSGSAAPMNPAAPADTASNANPASAPTANPTGSPAIADAIPAARGTAAEGVAIAALAETENIASSIAADTAAHRSAASVADVGHEGLSPSSAGPAPAGNPSGAAVPTGQLAGEAQNTQRFTWTAGGILAVADMAVNEPNAMSEASFAASQTARQETTPAPGRAMDGAAPTASGGTNAAAAGEATNPQSSDALMEQVEQTDLAIGTEESDTNNDNTAASAPANDAGEGTGDSDEKKKQR